MSDWTDLMTDSIDLARLEYAGRDEKVVEFAAEIAAYCEEATLERAARVTQGLERANDQRSRSRILSVMVDRDDTTAQVDGAGSWLVRWNGTLFRVESVQPHRSDCLRFDCVANV